MPRRDRERGTFSAPLFSRFLYPRFKQSGLKHGEGEHRQRLLDGIAGEVIEVGAGDGLNFAYYPQAVTGVLAVEPEDNLRAAASDQANHAPVPVEVKAGLADRLPADDNSFDAAVCSLVLCSVDDQAEALAEIRRVLRPGGQLRFYEHVRAHSRSLAAVQHAVTPVWSRLGGGCHLNRDTEGAITGAGFEIKRIERFVFAPSPLERLGGDIILGVGTTREQSGQLT